MKNNVLTFLLICCFSSSVISQQYFFKNYNINHGLLSNEVFDIIQANDRTLWIATFLGVSNFNGNKFTNYTKEDGLNGNIVRTVFEDSKNRIWVGFWDDGLNYIENGKIHTVSHPLLEEFPSVMQLFESQDNKIWIFTTKAILQYNNGDVKLIYKTKAKDDYASPNNILQTKDGTIWVATLGRGIAKIKSNPFSIEMINEATHKINDICYSLFEDSDGSIWVGSYGALYNLKNNLVKKYALKGKRHRNRVWSISKDDEGNLWLALYGNGFALFNKNNEFKVINTANGLTDNYAYKLIIDSENNKWIATQNNGIIKFRDFAFIYYTEKEGLPNKQINDIVQINDTTLCLATNRGVVNFSQEKFFNHRLQDEYIHAIDLDVNDKLWCSTTKKYGIIEKKLKDNLPKEIFYDLLITKDNRKVFVGEYYISTIDSSEEKTKRFFNLKARNILSVNDKLLIGSIYGLKVFYKDTVTKIKQPSKDDSPILSLAKLSENELFAGSIDYLTHIDIKDTIYSVRAFHKNRFKSIRDFSSLMVEGNNLWVGATNSLSKIDISELLKNDSIKIETYGRDLGFINGDPSKMIAQTTNSDLFLGTTAGLLKFSPSKFNSGTQPPILKLSEIKLFSKKFDDSLYLENGIVTLPYDKNYLAFTLSATSLTYPENIKYKYRLKGLRNNDWSTPSKKTEVVYSYLPAGDYTFEFTADNGFGVWQEKFETYNFVIKLPFWKTDGFKFIITALFLVVGFLIIYYTQRKKKLAQKRLTASLLSAQERERKRVSKELHDGIGQKLLLIKNSLKLDSKKTPQLVDSTIEDVRTISRNLHPFQLEKFGLTKAIINIIEEVNEFSEIFFSEEVDNIDDYFSDEKEIYLYRIIQECINNIIKHSKATAAKISIRNENKKIVITIQDNGIGFNFEKDKNNFKSLGLKSLQERVDFLNGKIKFNAQENQGTIITIISYK